jgi:hypothetical protein
MIVLEVVLDVVSIALFLLFGLYVRGCERI